MKKKIILLFFLIIYSCLCSNGLTLEALKEFSVDFLLGKFEPKKHRDFRSLATKHANNRNLYLHRDTYKAYKKMYRAALRDGIQLKILSAARSFNSQKRIWQAKWSGKRKVEGLNLSKSGYSPVKKALVILKYSSMPGTSRHHWGTDIDLNSFDNGYFERGKGKKIYSWLTNNAKKFGFCNPYTEKGPNRPFGYEQERWHWSYFPLAKIILHEYKKKISYKLLTGFPGARLAPKIEVIKKYVAGVNRDCK